jgi:hypothetical protein
VCSSGIGDIPPGVRIGKNSVIYQAYAVPGIHEGNEEVGFGSISGKCLIEAKRVTLAGERCVMSLVQPSG